MDPRRHGRDHRPARLPRRRRSLEGFAIAGESGAFGGNELVLLGAASPFSLTGSIAICEVEGARGRREPAGVLALMIAIGIGLHNMGEGLAIGSAYAISGVRPRRVARGRLCNPQHDRRLGDRRAAGARRRAASFGRLALLGVIAGAPAILGAVIGASVTTRRSSALLLGIGVGAVVQVIVQIAPSMRDEPGARSTPSPLLPCRRRIVFYLTSLLVTV